MSWYTLPTGVPWLTLVLVLPLAGALLVALTPGVAGRVIKQLGILTSVITLALVLAIIGGFQHGVGDLHLQFEEALPWIPALGISYHIGVDGLSLFLLGLNALLFLIAIIVTDPATPRLKQFVLLLRRDDARIVRRSQVRHLPRSGSGGDDAVEITERIVPGGSLAVQDLSGESIARTAPDEAAVKGG